MLRCARDAGGTAAGANAAATTLSGLLVVWMMFFPAEAWANAPNFYMLLAASPALFATVPVTVLIEAYVIKRFSEISWTRAILVACALYAISTLIGSYAGGGLMFAIHPIFFEARPYFYETVATLLFGTVNFAIESVALLVIFRFSLGLAGTAAFFAANLVTTAILFFVAYSGLF